MNNMNTIEIIKSYIRFIFVRIIQKAWKKTENTTLSNSKIEHILVFMLDAIGDMVMTTSFLRELRRNYTNAEITLVVKPAIYNLVEFCPYVNHVLTFQKIEGSLGYFLSFFKAREFVKCYLSNKIFDLAITPRWRNDSFCHAGILMYLSNARRRVAYSEHAYPEKELLDKGYDHFFTDFVPPNSEIVHEVERNLDVLRYLKCTIENDKLELWIENDDKSYADRLLKNSFQRRIILCPNSSTNTKEWDIKNYVQLLKKINQDYHFDVIVIGGKNTEKYGQYLESTFSNVYNFAGKTTLRQTIAILEKCEFFIGGDTGPMHMAAACNLSGIVISCHPIDADIDTWNSPIRFGPWRNPKMHVMQPIALPGCEHKCVKNYAHCINQITVNQVYDEIRSMLKP